MSTDTGILNDLNSKSLSSKDFNLNSNNNSKIFDTKPLSTTLSRTNDILKSGETLIKSDHFNNYLGTGTFSSSAKRIPQNNSISSEVLIESENSDESQLVTVSSAFNSNKFKPFSKDNLNHSSYITDDETIPSKTQESLNSLSGKRTRTRTKTKTNESTNGDFTDF